MHFFIPSFSALIRLLPPLSLSLPALMTCQNGMHTGEANIPWTCVCLAASCFTFCFFPFGSFLLSPSFPLSPFSPLPDPDNNRVGLVVQCFLF